MAYVTATSGQVMVPSAQYASPGTYYTSSNNAYPQEYRVTPHKPAPAPGKYAATFSYTSAILLGVFLVCSGATGLVGSAIGFRYYSALSEIGAGMWCGAMFIAAGSVSIAAGHHRTDCLICATTATAAFTVMFGIALTTISSVGLTQDINYYSCGHWCYNYPYYYSCPCYYQNWETLAIVANSLMIAAGATAIIFSFWLFIICCISLCRTPGPQIVPVQYIPVAQAPMADTATSHQQQVLSVPMQYVQMPKAQNHTPPVTVFQVPDHNHLQRSGDHHGGDDIGL